MKNGRPEKGRPLVFVEGELNMPAKNAAQPGHSFIGLDRGGEGEIDPHGIGSSAVGMEPAAGYKRHLFSYRLREQCVGIDLGGQGDPEEKAALWPSPLYPSGHVFFEGVKHDIPAFVIDTADGKDVLINKSMLTDFVCHHLVEGGGMEIHALLG